MSQNEEDPPTVTITEWRKAEMNGRMGEVAKVGPGNEAIVAVNTTVCRRFMGA